MRGLCSSCLGAAALPCVAGQRALGRVRTVVVNHRPGGVSRMLLDWVLPYEPRSAWPACKEAPGGLPGTHRKGLGDIEQLSKRLESVPLRNFFSAVHHRSSLSSVTRNAKHVTAKHIARQNNYLKILDICRRC